MSRMATRTTLPAKPTLGSHEWLMKSITGSYSSSVRATMWPPLTATTSPAAIGATANKLRPAMSLGLPMRALGEIHDWTVGIGSACSTAVKVVASEVLDMQPFGCIMETQPSGCMFEDDDGRRFPSLG